MLNININSFFVDSVFNKEVLLSTACIGDVRDHVCEIECLQYRVSSQCILNWSSSDRLNEVSLRARCKVSLRRGVSLDISIKYCILTFIFSFRAHSNAGPFYCWHFIRRRFHIITAGSFINFSRTFTQWYKHQVFFCSKVGPMYKIHNFQIIINPHFNVFELYSAHTTLWRRIIRPPSTFLYCSKTTVSGFIV